MHNFRFGCGFPNDALSAEKTVINYEKVTAKFFYLISLISTISGCALVVINLAFCRDAGPI
jgi:hypothetical protein